MTTAYVSFDFFLTPSPLAETAKSPYTGIPSLHQRLGPPEDT